MHYKNVLKLTLTSLTLISLSGCAGGGLISPATPVAKKQTSQIPQWYLNPQSSDKINFYGVGTGASKDEAKINALNQVAAEISVSVSSSMEIQKRSSNNSYSKNIESNTKATIEKMKFTGVDIVKNEYIDGKFYTYLKVDKDTLFDARKKELDALYSDSVSSWENIVQSGGLEIIKSSDKIVTNISTMQTSLPILYAINSSFDDKSYRAKIDKLANNIEDAKANVLVKIVSKNAPNYANIVKKYISSAGINIANGNSINNSNLVTIEVDKQSKSKLVKSSDPRLKGASFADVIVTIKTIANNKVVAQNSIKVLNISKEGYESAVRKTAKFEREIKNKGIMNILLENYSK